MTQFYKEFGVGKLGLHKAFRVAHDEEGVHIVPITKIAHVQLDELVGYESAKKKLIDNTEAFVKGRRANNCLLFGDAGTGKSSSIKAILNKYYDQGLRMIEVYKHQFQDLNDVIAQIKNRNYKFIIYMDDLSFEEFEIEYKYLKAVIEGGLERKPDNVLIYATSNRRHLIRESFRDKEERDEELHTNDTVQEKTLPGGKLRRHHLLWEAGQEGVPGDRPSAGKEKRHRDGRRKAPSGSQPLGAEPRRHVRADGPAVYRLPAGDGVSNAWGGTGKRNRQEAKKRRSLLGPSSFHSGAISLPRSR